MSSLLNDSNVALKEHRRSYKQIRRMCEGNMGEIRAMSMALADIPILRVSFDTDSIDIAVAGDYAVLKAIFHAFRTQGWEPTSRPVEQKLSSFSTHFEKPGVDLRFWLSFSSTLCRRVKVGTKMVEQPVYETVCE